MHTSRAPVHSACERHCRNGAAADAPAAGAEEARVSTSRREAGEEGRAAGRRQAATERRRREAAGVSIVVRAKRRAPLVEPEEVKEIV
jgi:hypothetical protein